MATIPTPGSELRHVRKTITFDGTAGNGAIGTVTVFTLTGRVLLKNLGVFVSTTLAGATAALQLGTPNHTNMFVNIPSPNVPNETGGSYMNPNLGSGFDSNPDLVQYGNQSSGSALTAGDIIWTIAGGAVTGGVVVVDAWYTPVTDDGALAGDDIDEDLKTNIWSKALSDIASVPAMTASALSGLNWLFALARNKRTQTATTETVYKDDGSTSLATSTKSDDGTTYTRGEYS